MRWAYKTYTTHPMQSVEQFEKCLNELGSEGWEMVGPRTSGRETFVFKRPVKTRAKKGESNV